MGEITAMAQSILGNYDWTVMCCLKSDPWQRTVSSLYLHSLGSDKLKYVHVTACCYNKCIFDSALEVAQLVKTIYGEINA
jgi:hypothetical protein